MGAAPGEAPTNEDVAASERLLIERLRGGDESAYEHLVREHGGRMLAVARRMLRNEEEAQDAVQDAFLSAFKAIDRFEGAARLGTWLHRIVVNAALMRIRSARRRRDEVAIEDLLPRFGKDGHPLDPPTRWRDAAEAVLERKELQKLVLVSIDRLPENYRSVLMLRDIEEMSTEEAASLLKIGAGVVKTRLHRARQALRSLLDPHLRKEAS
jgi:RNA polymerase sigma-70 factor (ECF subfamily)